MVWLYSEVCPSSPINEEKGWRLRKKINNFTGLKYSILIYINHTLKNVMHSSKWQIKHVWNSWLMIIWRFSGGQPSMTVTWIPAPSLYQLRGLWPEKCKRLIFYILHYIFYKLNQNVWDTWLCYTVKCIKGVQEAPQNATVRCLSVKLIPIRKSSIQGSPFL